MRARCRRKAPSAASRDTGAPFSAKAASAAVSKEADASGAGGWDRGVSISLIVLVRGDVGNWEQRFQTIQSVECFARRHLVRLDGGERSRQGIRFRRRIR